MDEGKILEEFNPYIQASIRRKFRFKDEDREDVVQDIYIGLLKALRKYDPSKGIPIGPYLSINLRFVIREVKRSWMLSSGWRRVESRKLEQRVKFIPWTNQDLSYKLKISELILFKNKVNDRELRIIDLYLDGFTMEEIGKVFNLSRTGISYIINSLKRYVN